MRRAGLMTLGAMVLSAGTILAQQPVTRPGQMPTLPLTELDERGGAADLDNRAFTLTFAQPVPIKDLLLLLVRGTTLSLVPDPSIGGSFIGELKNITVRQALALILPPLGLDFSVDGAVVRVFKREPQTRLFDLNYVAARRTADSRIGGPAGDASHVAVASAADADVFGDLTRGVKSLLSDTATFSVDRTAGLLQVTDAPDRLDRVARYLDAVQDRVQQQVELEARILEVELKDAEAAGLDWTALSQAATSGSPLPRRGLTGLRVTDLARLLAAIADQGKITTVAAPSILTLNNQPAVVRATTSRGTGDEARGTTHDVVLSVTPQVSGDGIVTLSLTPIVVMHAPAGDKSDETITREADTLARVASGETLVVAGFPRDRETRERRAGGIAGGWFGRSTVVTRKRVELVILLTPRILGATTAQ